MEKFDGKILSIRVFEPKQGMQVLYKTHIQGLVFIGRVTEIDERTNHATVHYQNLGVDRYLPIEQLYTLVVDYEDNDGWRKQIPLKLTQWQVAVDKGEVDSDITVTFEKKVGYENLGTAQGRRFDEAKIVYAKILPKRKRLYTEEEMIEAMMFASSHLSSMDGINRYINQLNRSKDSVDKLIAHMDDESNFIGED